MHSLNQVMFSASPLPCYSFPSVPPHGSLAEWLHTLTCPFLPWIFLFIFASSIALYFFPALCHIKLNGQSFFDPKFADFLQKSTLPKTTVAAGPLQTDRREASGFEKHYFLYLCFTFNKLILEQFLQVHL